MTERERAATAWRVTAAAALAALVLACGDSGPAKPSAKGTSGKPAASAGPSTGGYLVIPSGEPPLVNPVLQTSSELVTPLVFEGLVGLDARMELQPRLARSWELAPSGLVLTFALREGVTWHDGKPFTADDVLFTVEQIRVDANASGWRGYLAAVDKVEAPDAKTVRVTFKQPFGPALAAFTFGIIPRHGYEGDLGKAPANRAPVGTGPFRFTRWTPGQAILLEANATHWAGRPYLDQIEIVFDGKVPPARYLAALRERQLDFAPIRETSDWSGELATPEFREEFETGMVDEPAFTLIAWNGQRKPFDDKRVRVALAHALDRPRVIEDVFRSTARPMSGPFLPTMWGANPAIAPWPFDTDRASALLDEAGLKRKGGAGGNRLTLELLAPEGRRGPAYDEMLAIFRFDLARAGVELKVTHVPFNQLVDRLVLRNFDAALFQWGVDLPDPDPWALLHSAEIKGGANYASYANKEVDALLEAGRASSDKNKRKESYYKVHELVHADEPYTFLFAPQSHYAWSRRVHGVNPVDAGALPRWPGVARWWVDKAK